MFDFFVNQLQREGLVALIEEHDTATRNRIYQRIYDAGVSGPKIAKGLKVKDIYDRIDAHRGRGPGRRDNPPE